MGREIVHQEYVKEPGKRSRLWDPKEIRRILNHNKGTNAIEGIFMNLYEIKGINLDSRAFTNIPNLRMLKFYIPKFLRMSIEEQLKEQLSDFKVQLPDGLDYLSKNLRYLHWHKYPSRTLPSNFEPKNIVALSLPFSKVEQTWEGKKKAFKYLKFPQISGKITRLYLSQSAIEEVPSSIECRTDLEELDLTDCKWLKRISTRFSKLKSLVDHHLDDCLNLERFPEILEKMEHLKHIYLKRTAITELPSSFENLLGLESLSVREGSAISQLPSSVADSNILRAIFFSRCRNLVSFPPLLSSGSSSLNSLDISDCAVTGIPQDIACLSSLKLLKLSGNSFESLPASIKQLSQLSTLRLENSRNCKLLQSLPEIRSPLEEPDASVLEKLSKYSHNPTGGNTPEISLGFTNCLKLNEKANNRILADSRLRIQHMIIALPRQLDERAKNKEDFELRACTIALPGSEIPDWFSNQSSGHLISIQLPSHSFCRNLIGFAFCAVVDFKQDLDCSDTIGDGRQFNSLKSPCMSVGYFFRLETKTVSEAKHVNRYNHCEDFQHPIDSDHFSPAVGDATYGGHGVKCCGVCTVYANPNETKANTYTLNFATEVGKLDDLPSASGTSNEEELEPSPKRICRADQINTP
ncbi:hypothetical protein WN944_015867 [Citrus x changshan-huyou]|uniref:Disease resistance protein n=1 Tax=Citrus x changshan-huyou TaxID=2935761 RepID=A0AAP0M9T7_9ROSI